MVNLPFKNVSGFNFNFSNEIKAKIEEGHNRYLNGEKLSVSKLTGKLSDIKGISTIPLINSFCEKMQKKEGSICQKCYSIRLLLTARKNAISPWSKNTYLLTEEEIKLDNLPKFKKGDYIRFNPHGELTNIIMMKNFVNIAKKNPDCFFCLFTKRTEIVKEFLKNNDIPINIVMVKSAYKINSIETDIPEGFNFVFNVVTNDFTEKNNIKINCMQKCIQCKKCYKNGYGLIFEELK